MQNIIILSVDFLLKKEISYDKLMLYLKQIKITDNAR